MSDETVNAIKESGEIMKKSVWVICGRKQDMVMAQQCINQNGSMRAVCILTMEALKHKTEGIGTDDAGQMPSVLLIDYEMYRENNELYEMLSIPMRMGIPLFFMTDDRSGEIVEACYELGAAAVLKKPLQDISIKRMEQAIRQHHMTKDYEATLQKQSDRLRMAKEIASLNEQLQSRNELLYRIFGKYFSDEVVEVILKEPQGADLGGQRLHAAVMIADLRGFTSLSEKLAAETVVDILNQYLGEMTRIIRARHGTIIEFIGDEILAVFGAPVKCENCEEEAMVAAIEMQNCMHTVNAYCLSKGYPEIEMGIGLHSGEVFVGNIGSENLMRYNVVGQAVNLCSRIESFSVGGQILLSHDTIKNSNRPVKCNQETEISVKGFSKPIKIYELLQIETDQVYELQREAAVNLMKCEEESFLWVRPLLDKRVLGQGVKHRVKAIGEKYILFERDYSEREWKQYQNIEMAKGKEATEFAYAKVVELTEEGILARITFLPKDFLRR